MDTKYKLTLETLKDSLGQTPDDVLIRKNYKSWWFNIRTNGERSLRLTSEGFKSFSNFLKFYKIDLPGNTVWTSQLVIWLDKFIDCPWYINKTAIYVSREKVAVQMILFGGDLYKFGKSKNTLSKIH